jgi:hypothetical protein
VYIQDDNSANPVQVATIDPKDLTAGSSQRIYQEVAQQYDDPEDRALAIYERLGAKPSAPIPGPQITREDVNPYQPGKYVVPQANSNGSQVGQQPMPAPAIKQAAQAPPVAPAPVAAPPVAQQAPPVVQQQEPVPAQQPVQPPAYQPQALVQVPQPQVDYGPAIQQLQSGMMAMQNQFAEQMSNLVDRLAPSPPAPAPEPESASLGTVGNIAAGMPPLPEVEQEPEPPAPVEEKPVKQGEYTKEELRHYTLKAVDKALEGLNIPGLSFQADEPNFEVSFDFGDMGETSSRYHWVSVESGGLFLVFDTRFKYSNVYTPPNLGPNRFVNVRINGQTYKCGSTKFVHQFGVFKIINLIVIEQSGSDMGPPPIHESVMAGNMKPSDDDLDYIMGTN